MIIQIEINSKRIRKEVLRKLPETFNSDGKEKIVV